MLRPDKLRVGSLAAERSSGLTLLLPRGPHEQAALIGQAQGQQHGVVLDGDLPAQAYVVQGEGTWSGLLVSNVIVEVDEMTAFDPASELKTGALIREADRLSILAQSGPYPRLSRPLKVVLLEKLPLCDPDEGAGFGSWRLLVGDGIDRRQLLSIDVETIAAVRTATLATQR